MSDIHGTTRAQTIFLRAFRDNPAGPPPDAWPTPAILRRWLRRPAFRAAFYSLRDTLRAHSDFSLAALANSLTTTLSRTLPTLASNQEAAQQTIRDCIHLLRLCHLRQRFQSDPAFTAHRAVESALLKRLLDMPGNTTVDYALDLLAEDSPQVRKALDACDDDADQETSSTQW